MRKGISISLSFVWISIPCQLKWINKIYKLGNLDDIIPILQLDPGAEKRKRNRDMNRERWF